MTLSRDEMDDLLADVIEAFDQEDFVGGLNIIDRITHELDDLNLRFLGLELCKAGYPQEAIYSLHNAVWTTKNGRTDFKTYSDGRPEARPLLAGPYMWALILHERQDCSYAYPESGTAPPKGAVDFFEAYRALTAAAIDNHYFITDGMRAHFETIVRKGGAARDYDLAAVRDAMELSERLGHVKYRRKDTGVGVPYAENDRFMLWQASLQALVYNHPATSDKRKDGALRETKKILNKYFTALETERDNAIHHGRLPNVPREAGALVYALGDRVLISRLEQLMSPHQQLDDMSYARAVEVAERLLDHMREDAQHWPLVRHEHLRAAPTLSIGNGDPFGVRAFSDAGRPRRPAAAAPPAAREVAERRAPEELARPRGGPEQREIQTREGIRTIGVERKRRPRVVRRRDPGDERNDV